MMKSETSKLGIGEGVQDSQKMSEDLMEKVTAFGERLMISGADVGKKVSAGVSAGVSSMSFKMKEFFQGPNQADMIVEEATAESMDVPDWTTNLEICDMINNERINSVELIRAVKKRIAIKSPRVQYFALVLLETVVQNCDRAFSEVAAERVLDEMVRLVDDPQTVVNNRNKALFMIQVWGESSDELRYLPVYEETYKSLRLRGIQFPGRDTESLVPNLTPASAISQPVTNAAFQQHASPVLPTFSPEQIKEAFNVARNCIELLSTVLSSSPHQDVLKKVLSKYKDLKKASTTTTDTSTQQEPEPTMIPISVQPEEDREMMDDLDEMIFGKKSGSTSEGGSEPPKKKQSEQDDDLISF
ncbi:hypothetical protein V2J09_015729 [Rumex salicifolius]